MKTKCKNITGQRFGRLEAIKIHSHNPQWTKWLCKCDCGNEVVVFLGSLTGGRSRSCGCLKNDVTRARMTIHGGHKSPEYVAWSNMRQRCSNANAVAYPDYGGRGIRVCDRWQVFENFIDDMGKRPPGMTIERKNNDGHYEPSNCVWATRMEQTRNTRRSCLITFNGETKCLSDWAATLGLDRERIRGRLRLGWSFEEAIA